ncbi:hypothetical protein R1flu_013871 [Riccia fluitans]|uniref:Uncharacterized protein n=1 Tax=Riccia fluitans TaxID=41844 RepID=A0ABD1YF75_9MARC
MNIREILPKEQFQARMECWRRQIKFNGNIMVFKKPIFYSHKKNVSAHVLVEREIGKTKSPHLDTTDGGQKKQRMVFKEETNLSPNEDIPDESSMPT